MAKGLRSKIKKRWRVLKRNHLETVIGQPRRDQVTQNLNASLLGVEYRKPEPKNAFLHPDDADSKFPQVTYQPIIDLRSSAIPESGLEWSGASRKKSNKMITKEYKPIGDEEMGMVQVEEKENSGEEREEEKMMEEKAMGPSRKVKKQRKSKLRKTMVF